MTIAIDYEYIGYLVKWFGLIWELKINQQLNSLPPEVMQLHYAHALIEISKLAINFP